jgi:hypothetical protein
MEDSAEYSEWWVPGKPDTRVHGVLTFDPIEGASLTLLDPLPEVRASRLNAPTLLGETFDGKPLTLLHPFVTSTADRSTPTRWRSRSTLVAPTLLHGCHVEDPDALVFSRAIVRFAGLRDICLQEWPSGENREWVPFVGPGLLAKQATIDGGVVLFRRCEDRVSERYSKSSEIDIEAHIAIEGTLSLVDFDEQWISPLETLTILAADGPTRLEYFALTLSDENGAETDVEVSTRLPALAPEPLPQYRPLVRLAALGEDALPFIARWWQLHRDLGPAAQYLNAALSGDMYLEQKLLIGMSFAESYHRQLHDEPVLPVDEHKQNMRAMLDALPDKGRRERYLALLQNGVQQSARERVASLIDRAHETLPDVPGLDATLAKELTATRNAVAHLSRSISKALDGVDLVYAVARLRLVIQVNLLLDLGLASALVGEIVLACYDRRVLGFDYGDADPPADAPGPVPA